MTSTVKVQKHQDHVAIKVIFKNPQTGEVLREDVLVDTEIHSYVIYDTQSLEIEEIPAINK